MNISFMSRAMFEPGGWAYEFHGGNCLKLRPNVAGREKRSTHRFDPEGEWHDVTWDEIMDRRRARQVEIMERKLRPALPNVLPCYVWTFYINGFPFGGWHCYIVTRHFDFSLSFYRNRPFNAGEIAVQVMEAFPCGLLPLADNLNRWMPAFAKAYPRSRNWPGGKVLRRGEHDPRKAGLAYGWLADRSTFSLSRPEIVNPKS